MSTTVDEQAPAVVRCFGDGDPLYETYHDTEWGWRVRGDSALFERIALEGFQSGLSWITVLKKREAFREVFHGFDPATVARMGPDDVDRLLTDARIIRHRGKIEATINNARVIVNMQAQGDSLDELVWSFAPTQESQPQTWEEVPTTTVQSQELAKTLKKLGFRFFGPTTAYAAMQAIGMVNNHLASCTRQPGN